MYRLWRDEQNHCPTIAIIPTDRRLNGENDKQQILSQISKQELQQVVKRTNSDARSSVNIKREEIVQEASNR